MARRHTARCAMLCGTVILHALRATGGFFATQRIRTRLRLAETTLTAALTIALVAMTTATVGCEGFAFLAAMGGERIKAAYTLPDRPTLVMVEDPNNVLDDPALPRVVAGYAGHYLKNNEVITTGLIDQADLAALADRLGDDYRTMAIDRIGEQLGAAQVIHVLIDEARLETAPGVYRPTATAEVKVIDAIESRRLYPAARRTTDRDTPPPGHRVHAELKYHTDELGGAGAEVAMMRALAERLGLNVAQVFYDHHRPEPGSRLP